MALRLELELKVGLMFRGRRSVWLGLWLRLRLSLWVINHLSRQVKLYTEQCTVHMHRTV